MSQASLCNYINRTQQSTQRHRMSTVGLSHWVILSFVFLWQHSELWVSRLADQFGFLLSILEIVIHKQINDNSDNERRLTHQLIWWGHVMLTKKQSGILVIIQTEKSATPQLKRHPLMSLITKLVWDRVNSSAATFNLINWRCTRSIFQPSDKDIIRNLTATLSSGYMMWLDMIKDCLADRQPTHSHNKKAQLSLTNPRDAKACQKLLQFDVLTTFSLTILAYHLAVVASKICEILRNSLKIQTYRVQSHPRSSILVSMKSPYVTSY